jgi:hypothetical protein
LESSKSQYIIFKHPNKKKIPSNLTLKLDENNDNVILPTKCVKYLGLKLDSSLSFKPHIYEYLLPKLNKKLGWLFMITKFNYNTCGNYPNILSYQSLYKMILRPTMDYACAFYNGSKSDTYKNELNKIQKKALTRGMKLMNNVSYDSCNVINYIEPLNLRRESEEIKLLKRSMVYSVHFPNHTLSKTFQYWWQNASTTGVYNHTRSVLTRAFHNARLYNIKLPDLDELSQQPKLKQMARIIELPEKGPTNTPFKHKL